jgi:hypothetical protein
MSQHDVDLIKDEFNTAGYSLPENELDHLVQETIKNEFGDRATLRRALQNRGVTYEQFREQIKERFIRMNLRAQVPLTNTVSISGETNGIVVKYGPTTLRADRMTIYPDQDRIVAEGHVNVQEKEQNGKGQRPTLNAVTDQAPSQQKVNAIEIRYVGPKSVKEAEIRRRIRVEAGKRYTQTSVDDDVRNLYATGLFYNVRVSTEFSPKGVDLIYNVQCNPRIEKLKFAGNSKFSDAQLQKLIRSKIGEVFNERQTFSDAQAIQKAYANAGLKGTEVNYSYDVDQPTGKAPVVFEIKEKN